MKHWLNGVLLLAIAGDVAVGFEFRAHAQGSDDASREAGRSLAYEGVAAYQRGDFNVAQDRLNRSYELLKAPSVGLWSARALVKNGLWVEAATRLLDASRIQVTTGKKEVQEKAKEDAIIERESLLQRMPKLTIEIAEVDRGAVNVRLDEKLVHAALLGVGQPINPGHHSLVATYRGREQRRSFEAVEAAVTLVSFAFNTKNSVPPLGAPIISNRRASDTATRDGKLATLGWTSLGLGGALVVSGGFLSLVALSEKNHLNCGAGNLCSEERRGEVETYNSHRRLSTLGLAGGALFSAVGASLVLAEGRRHPRTLARTQVQLVWRGIQVESTF